MPGNKSTPEELQEKKDAALNAPPAESTPPANPEVKIEDVRSKKVDELSEPEKTFVQEHADEFSDEEKTNLGIATAPPAATPPADEGKFNLDESRQKEISDLEEGEYEFLEEHAGELTDNERGRFAIELPAQPTPPAPPPATPLPPVEERYKHQRVEAQIQDAKIKKFGETVENAANLPEPKEEELKAEYPDWDMMTETEKRLAKDNLMNKRKFDMVHQATQEGKQLEEWAGRVDSFITTALTKPEFGKLAGKEEEFKAFCMKPTRRGVDLEDLANAFLNIVTETPAPRKRGSLLESGSGSGGQRAPEGGFIDEKQAAELRTKNHKLYQRLVKAGKIKIQI